MITQLGLPPHTMRCTDCGATWEPPPARGKDRPTDSSLDLQARRHFDACPRQPEERNPPRGRAASPAAAAPTGGVTR